MIEIEEVWCFTCQRKMEQGSKFMLTDGQHVGHHFTCYGCGVHVFTTRALEMEDSRVKVDEIW